MNVKNKLFNYKLDDVINFLKIRVFLIEKSNSGLKHTNLRWNNIKLSELIFLYPLGRLNKN